MLLILCKLRDRCRSIDFVRRRLLAEALHRLTAPSAEPQRRGDGLDVVLVVVQLRLVAAGPELPALSSQPWCRAAAKRCRCEGRAQQAAHIMAPAAAPGRGLCGSAGLSTGHAGELGGRHAVQLRWNAVAGGPHGQVPGDGDAAVGVRWLGPLHMQARLRTRAAVELFRCVSVWTRHQERWP